MVPAAAFLLATIRGAPATIDLSRFGAIMAPCNLHAVIRRPALLTASTCGSIRGFSTQLTSCAVGDPEMFRATLGSARRSRRSLRGTCRR